MGGRQADVGILGEKIMTAVSVSHGSPQARGASPIPTVNAILEYIYVLGEFSLMNRTTKGLVQNQVYRFYKAPNNSQERKV